MTDPSGGLPDMSSLLEQAAELRARLLGDEGQTFEGTAGGGAVRVTVGSTGEFQKVTIRPDVVDRDDVAMLEDLVLAAVRDASTQVAAHAQQGLGAALGGLFGGGAGGGDGTGEE